MVQAQDWQPEWSTATLSQARLYMAGVSAGNDVLFAGGYGVLGYSSAVDIYNASTNAWSTATLSQARDFLAGATAGSDVLFAGGLSSSGYSNVVDIYNSSTGTWSTAD